MRERSFPYDEWLLSGRQIFLAEGIDFSELQETARQKLQDAGKRRGLKVATQTVFDPPGFIFQAYLPGQPRPTFGVPTQGVNKKTHPHLFCREDRCDTRLRPIDDEHCSNHK